MSTNAPRNTREEELGEENGDGGGGGGALADISVQQLVFEQNPQTVPHLLFADVDPEVNVQIMD